MDLSLVNNHGVTGKIILDSISPEDIRLTTIHVRYPRMIHSEVMTHRALSKNGRSSRAVPVKTLLKESVYVPHFMANQPGMVASVELSMEAYEEAVTVWNTVAQQIKDAVQKLNDLGVHKQWANRLLEPIGYIDFLVTGTDWANFFALRDEDGAQPEINAVAKCIKKLLAESTPNLIDPLKNEWHMPYINYEEDFVAIMNELKDVNPEDIHEAMRKVSVARCARLTIKPFDGDGSIVKELARYEKLMVSRPVHASPAEHVASPDILETFDLKIGQDPYWLHKEQWGNFYGWRQFRKMIPDNTILDR